MMPSDIEEQIEPIKDFLGDLALTGLTQDTLIFGSSILTPIVKCHQKALNDYLKKLKQESDLKNEALNFSLIRLLKKDL